MTQAGAKISTSITNWDFEIMSKKISDIVSSADFLSQRDNKESERDLDPLTVLVVNRLFNFFEANCPGFDKQFRGRDDKLKTLKISYAREFMSQGINQIEQIDFGIKKCRREGPINVPSVAQFLILCRPSLDDLGLLSKEQAYNRAFIIMRDGDPKDLSPDQIMLIRKAIQESGSHFLKNNSQATTQTVFYRNYDILVRDFIAGKIQPVHKGLEDKHEETIELKKQETASKGFEDLNSYEKAMPEIRKIVGMNADGTKPTKR